MVVKILFLHGAGDQNRTDVASLEGWSFTTKLHPQLTPHVYLSHARINPSTASCQ